MTRQTNINVFYLIPQIFSYISYFLYKWGYTNRNAGKVGI